MSDGKRYALQFVNQSADEIIAEVQRKYSIIIERLQAYDHLIQSHDQLQKSVSCVERKVDAFSEQVEIQRNVYNHASASLHQNIRELHDRLKDLQSFLLAPIQELQDNAKDLDLKLAYVHQRITDNYATTNNNLNSIVELNDKSEKQQISQLNTFQYIKELKEKLNAHDVIHEQISQKVASSEDKARGLLDGFHSKFSSLLDLESKFKDFQREIESKMLRLNVAVREEVQKLSLSLEGRHKENLESLAVNQAECKKTINDNFIDIKNSQIKLDIINKQIVLLEKKIENVNLLLKKHELDK